VKLPKLPTETSPQRSGTSKPSPILLPLPLGEGWGEGALSTRIRKNSLAIQPVRLLPVHLHIDVVRHAANRSVANATLEFILSVKFCLRWSLMDGDLSRRPTLFARSTRAKHSRQAV
jgi:hypothetical protein